MRYTNSEWRILYLLYFSKYNNIDNLLIHKYILHSELGLLIVNIIPCRYFI